jgi:hypothetical protein
MAGLLTRTAPSYGAPPSYVGIGEIACDGRDRGFADDVHLPLGAALTELPRLQHVLSTEYDGRSAPPG